MAPEGTRSKSEALVEGKPGAAYLAGKTGLPIIPVGLTGTEDRVVKARLRRLRRLRYSILELEIHFICRPWIVRTGIVYLEQNTDEIMCRIAALIPPSYRGVYADHPRLHELLEEQAIIAA